MKQNTVERKIAWGDLDSGGIVFYPRYFEWMDACSHNFFETIGINLFDLWHERKLTFGLVETSGRYFKPGRYHQEIRMLTRIETLEAKTVLLKHTIQELNNHALLVKGFEKRICLDVTDSENLKALEIPEDIYGVLKKAQ